MRAVELVERVKSLPGVRPLMRRRYERFFATAQNVQLFRGVYGSFAEARASAPRTKPMGYDDPGPAAMYRTRLTDLYPTDYPALFWLSKVIPEVTSLFDFGGHVGVKYYAYASRLSLRAELSWVVCDVPAVARAGEALARERAAKHLSFVTEFSRASGAGVLLCAGSLQYVETPLWELLASLPEPPAHVIINATPLSDVSSYVTLNSIGTAFCPYAVRRRGELIERTAALGYRVVDEWEHPGKTCIIPFHPEHSLSSYRGLYLARSS